jgi:hypothetical protein
VAVGCNRPDRRRGRAVDRDRTAATAELTGAPTRRAGRNDVRADVVVTSAASPGGRPRLTRRLARLRGRRRRVRRGRRAATDAEPASPAAAPPPALASEPEAPPQAAATSAPALSELDRAWPGIVAELSKSPPIKPLIQVCRPIALDGDVVTLGFPEGQSFLKDVAERRRATLEEGIGRALGRSVAVRLVATNLDLLPPPDDEDAERVLEAARRIFADDLVDAGEVG